MNWATNEIQRSTYSGSLLDLTILEVPSPQALFLAVYEHYRSLPNSEWLRQQLRNEQRLPVQPCINAEIGNVTKRNSYSDWTAYNLQRWCGGSQRADDSFPRGRHRFIAVSGRTQLCA